MAGLLSRVGRREAELLVQAIGELLDVDHVHLCVFTQRVDLRLQFVADGP